MSRLVTCAFFLALHLSIAVSRKPDVYKPYTYVPDTRPVLKPDATWWKSPQTRPYKVFLCLDGGGLRGIIPTTVLIEVERQIKTYILNHLEDFVIVSGEHGSDMTQYNFNTVNDFHIFISDFFDAIAGISAGSWVTAYLVTNGGLGQSINVLMQPHIVSKYGSHRPGSLTGLRVYFLEYGTRIYTPSRIPITLKLRWWATPTIGLKQGTEPQYTPDDLEWTLRNFIGDAKLSEVKTSMLVIAYDLYRNSAIEFIADDLGSERVIYTGISITRSSEQGITTEDTGEKQSREDRFLRAMDKLYDLDYHVRDIVHASSAFPLYHPSKLVKPLNDITNYFDLIDGAIVGNNPTLPTLAWALTHDYPIGANETAFLSLGTGFSQGSYVDIVGGGLVQWLTPIMSLVLAGTPEYIQSIMDFFFYEISPLMYDIQPNQLLRIQLMRSVETREGVMIGAVDGPPEDIAEMEEMAALLAARYRANIADFIESFMLKRIPEDEILIHP